MKISPRRKEVLYYLCQGYKSKEIAQKMSIALTTVKTHISQLFWLTGTTSQGELISMAFNRGIIQPCKDYWEQK